MSNENNNNKSKPAPSNKERTEKAFKSILIFTDGACSGNPGIGGWGAVVVTPEGHVRELGGKDAATTNNRMEMVAVIEALRSVQKDLRKVVVYTDSTYVIRGITQWIWAWRNRDWKNAEGEDVSNKDLWQEMAKVVSARGNDGKIEWHYSRGHVGTPGNERCDEIAVNFTKGKWVELFDGELLNYPIAIYDLPEDATLPEMKPKTEKKVAHSYLSFLGGEVYRHKDWASCERRVKGRSGAKFKKAMSATEESEILASWGLPKNTAVKE